MVHRSRLKKDEPKRENQWSVYCKGAFNLVSDKASLKKETQKLAREVQTLIKSEGKQDEVKIATVMRGRGMILVTCNDAFGRKLKSLPSADAKSASKVRYYKMAGK